MPTAGVMGVDVVERCGAVAGPALFRALLLLFAGVVAAAAAVVCWCSCSW